MPYRLRKNLISIFLIALTVAIYGTIGFFGFKLNQKIDFRSFLATLLPTQTTQNIINIKVYAPADTEGFTESSINEFIDNINKMKHKTSLRAR